MAEPSMTAADWGSIVTGVAAVIGLIFAGAELGRSADQRKEDREWRNQDRKEYRASMARAVGLNVTQYPGMARATIVNSGSFPVERLEVYHATAPVDGAILFDVGVGVAREFVGTVFANGDWEGLLQWPGGGVKTDGNFDDYPVGITFVDTWGQHWRKVWNGALEASGEPELPYPD